MAALRRRFWERIVPKAQQMATHVQDASQTEEQCRQADPASAIEHFVVCAACGQIFDCRDHVAVTHHSTPEHVPQRPPNTPIKS
jgi:hypothetical protein